MNNEFTPMVIGLPDTKKEQAIIKIYSEICQNASALLWNVEFYLDCPDKMELSIFFDFLKEKDPKDFLYLRYIEYHALTFPGIAIAKIIEFGMVDVPVDHFNMILTCRAELLKQIQQTKDLNFFYPLSKLFDLTEDNRGFATTNMEWGFNATGLDEREYRHTAPDFDERLFNHVRKFTASEKENEVLAAIEQAVDSLNKLVRLGIIRNDRQRWQIDLDNLIYALVFTLNEENPLSINPNLPKLKGFVKQFEQRGRNRIQGSPDDVLKFEVPATEQPEDSPEDLLQNEDQGAEQIEAIPEEIFQTE